MAEHFAVRRCERQAHGTIRQPVNLNIRPRACRCGGDAVALHPLFGPQEEIHVPDDAGHAPLVLILQIGAVAPLEHQQHHFVFALAQKRRSVKLAGVVGHLAVAQELSVDVDIEATVHALEVQHPPHAACQVGLKTAAVYPSRVFHRHIGRIIGKGIPDIDIRGLAKAVQLPVARHGHGARKRHTDPILRQPIRAVEAHEIPLAVQRDPPGRMLFQRKRILSRSKRGILVAIGGCAHMEHGRVFVIPGMHADPPHGKVPPATTGDGRHHIGFGEGITWPAPHSSGRGRGRAARSAARQRPLLHHSPGPLPC